MSAPAPANDDAPTILLVATEPSGDALGAALLRELKIAFPTARFAGCGGPLMAAEGFSSLFPIERLSVMGVTDVLRAYPEGRRRVAELAALAAERNAAAAVLIDAWTFSAALAERIRARRLKTKLFKLAAPQVWGSRPHRARIARRLFDGVLCLLPFEPAIFAREGVTAAFVGNPNFQNAHAYRGDGAAFRKRHGLGRSKVLVVLPGSRRGELRHHLKPFGDAVEILAERVPQLRVVAALPPQVEGLARPEIAKWRAAPIFIPQTEKFDAFAAADAALAKSGTVTTELAINGAPFVVAYKVDPVTAVWARLVKTAPFVTILNMAAGEEIAPELLQNRCRGDYLAADLLPLLTDKEARLAQIEAFPRVLAYLGVAGPPAARLAAAKIAEWTAEKPGRT